MSKVAEFSRVEGKAFNVEVSKVITSLKGADRSLVDLVAAAGYRWYEKDRGSNDTIVNLITSLDAFPHMQRKVVEVVKTFGPFGISATPTEDGGNVYAVETEIALKALTSEQKEAFKAKIKEFEDLNLTKITDYGKKKADKKEPKKLDLLTTTTKTTKAVEKVLEKALADGVDRAAALNSLAAWIKQELKSLESVPEVDKAA
ncbi:hypothetical protein DS608_21745 [Salmonella enterica subsp. enterica serovar Javiana]|nr:hypothetical protein [Salmonella enterica subsp. enterica serovar Javiana]